MPEQDQYKDVINEIIAKQVAVLGPDVALTKAQQIDGMKVDASGKVVKITGDPQQTLQRLVDSYFELSGQIVRNIIQPVFEKYPSVKVDIK